ncbi:S-methyl-5'-thioadenosine phosphorylase [Motilibacter deserti]|uniref:S-methyl-5'-thioadenosine phosphorylase n=1 Tax=Motilibacter deserti TaxID=2714956 RepID=UPI0038B36E83
MIGGSGFYRFLDDASVVEADTPYGSPSGPLAVGEVRGVPVAFLPRHGPGHRFPPHRVPSRANLWALRALGVRQVLAPYAVGSLRADLAPGRFVVPDQLIDRTWGREHTYADGSDGVVHVPFADPYCPDGRRAVLAAGSLRGDDVVDGGTLVVVNGPRFSTRAESRWHAASGGDVVGMTAMPEAALARELALCYTGIALVTDFDAGVGEDDFVTQEEVFRVMAANVERVRALLADVVVTLPSAPTCSCAAAVEGQRLPYALP